MNCSSCPGFPRYIARAYASLFMMTSTLRPPGREGAGGICPQPVQAAFELGRGDQVQQSKSQTCERENDDQHSNHASWSAQQDHAARAFLFF
jgi:hypothetical protein